MRLARRALSAAFVLACGAPPSTPGASLMPLPAAPSAEASAPSPPKGRFVAADEVGPAIIERLPPTVVRAAQPAAVQGAVPVVVVPTSTSTDVGLPLDVVRRVLLRGLPRLRACYRRELGRDPTLRGRVTITVVVDTFGAERRVATSTGAALAEGELVGCIGDAAGELAFPAPRGGMVQLELPIDFEP